MTEKAEKKLGDAREFAESVNKTSKRRNGNRVSFSVARRKWKH